MASISISISNYVAMSLVNIFFKRKPVATQADHNPSPTTTGVGFGWYVLNGAVLSVLLVAVFGLYNCMLCLFGLTILLLVLSYFGGICFSSTKRKCLKVGPWGGNGGGSWTFVPDGRITQLNIRCGYIVDAVYFNYMDKSGKSQESDRFGGRRGGLHQVTLGKDEEITNISGSVGTFEGCTVITKLIFLTNSNTYGPYGTCEGTDHFSLPVTKGKIIGFYGRHGIYLDSIGVVLAPSAC